MKRVSVAIVAALSASFALAQAPVNPNNSAGAAATAAEQAKNTAKSKETAKMTTAEKNKAIKEANKSTVNPDNSASAGATSAMQKSTTATSKATEKNRPNLGTQEAQKAMQKASTP